MSNTKAKFCAKCMAGRRSFPTNIFMMREVAIVGFIRMLDFQIQERRFLRGPFVFELYIWTITSTDCDQAIACCDHAQNSILTISVSKSISKLMMFSVLARRELDERLRTMRNGGKPPPSFGTLTVGAPNTNRRGRKTGKSHIELE
jgi:hypothetical protein